VSGLGPGHVIRCAVSDHIEAYVAEITQILYRLGYEVITIFDHLRKPEKFGDTLHDDMIDD